MYQNVHLNVDPCLHTGTVKATVSLRSYLRTLVCVLVILEHDRPPPPPLLFRMLHVDGGIEKRHWKISQLKVTEWMVGVDTFTWQTRGAVHQVSIN